MDKLDQYRVFIQVADMGSFIKAAHALELPRASVSAAVQQLEASVGVRLLHRTTRRVQLTADGAQLRERVRALLTDVEEIDQLFQIRQRQVSGQLKVDMPSRIARRLVVPALPGLLRNHPALRLALNSTDRAVDLVQEGVDCAVRVGTLYDSNLVAQSLGNIAMINCASPGYLREYGVPERPDDLLDGHLCVGYASPTTGRELPWDYLAAGREAQIPVVSRVIVNNAENYISCCCEGIGLIQIPRFDVQHLLNAGTLVEVMPEFRAAPMAVSALYPHRRQRSRRLVAFIEWFKALMQPHFEP
ncbi:bacterial regulatory helix-turn-helix, lysR family protein [Paraburkholderia xenovorans LB400]|jgi:DNA-binding transcriptional LysR family regulator|uniref:Transcriptional regulator, LysR family n=1 Tax=Paraburkholderia xenovorans (strain LB400) TaxID=266265 RepID=Q13MY5_PARXL|nr:LysR substrate-binding domain-containing protein [Paraburkholderia xenovorans]ABE34554.1 transcriptional regulator, LysR family [Paraburkholderia xenovorans LB400]AIP36443.1 bacterial regulatory helix-turn-helix, lysR family protein [Paraburkholderia xenovorans LB400]NPT33355.1 LysR family transcriptional regulator [Paraburkholderia xenovorans]